MMSMFSPFDILSGEIFGQKTNNMPSSHSSGSKKSLPEAVKLDDGQSPPPPQKKQQQGIESEEMMRGRRQRKVPRFGVEFDGLHCFETILPC